MRTPVISQVLEYRRAGGLLLNTPFSKRETRGCWPPRTPSTSKCVIEIADLSVFECGTVFLPETGLAKTPEYHSEVLKGDQHPI